MDLEASEHSGTASAALLRGAGLRLTSPRHAVIDALRANSHVSAEDVHAHVARRRPETSLQSVYNALGDFVDAGLVRRIEPAGRPRLYELRVGDNHHHAVCTTCGAVADIECATGVAPCLVPVDAAGFSIHTAEVTYWGLCPACAAAPAPPFRSDAAVDHDHL